MAIDLLFDADAENVKDDLLEVIVEHNEVLELLPLGQLFASDPFFVQGFESIDKSVLELMFLPSSVSLYTMHHSCAWLSR